MKVCLLGYPEKYFWRGSSTLNVQNSIHKYLNLTNVECDLFVNSKSKKLYSVLFDSIEYDQTKNGKIITGGLIPFLRFLINEKYNIIHLVVTRNYMAIIALLSFLYKAKLIATFHDTIVFPNLPKLNSREIKLFITKWIICKTSSSLLVYHCDDRTVIKNKYPTVKVEIVKNGIDENLLYIQNAGENIRRVFYSGGKDKPFKGFDFLLAGFRKLDSKVNLLVCGEGEKKCSDESNLGELSHEQFLQQLIDAGVLVVPSMYDSFSITVLEALAVGTPVILTDNCGVSKYLTDGNGCFIVKYGDVDTLAQRIELLTEDITVWKRMSSEAKIVAKEFVWSNIISDYVMLYSSMAV